MLWQAMVAALRHVLLRKRETWSPEQDDTVRYLRQERDQAQRTTVRLRQVERFFPMADMIRGGDGRE